MRAHAGVLAAALRYDLGEAELLDDMGFARLKRLRGNDEMIQFQGLGCGHGGFGRQNR